MKKVLILSLILILVVAFFSYDKHFKYLLPKEYKNEINILLEKEIPKSIKEIDELFEKIDNEKDPFDKQGLIEMGTDEIVFYLFIKIKAIIQKYRNIEKLLVANGDVGQLILTIMPYLKKNKIDTEKLEFFLLHTDEERLRIEKAFKDFTYFDYLH